MPDASLPSPSKELFARAEIHAEQTVGLLRIVITVALAIVLMIVLLRAPAPTESQSVLIRQWIFAGGTLFAYLLLGLASVYAVARNIYRPWMAWAAVTGDCAFLLANVELGLENTELSADYLICLPPVWLAPAVLAFGALRFNPLLQGYMVLLLTAGFLAIAAAGVPMHFSSSAPLPERLGLFFALPPNVMRLAMFVLAGAILVVASSRARALLTRAIRETQRGINLTRYLPQQMANRLADAGLEELRRGRRQDVAVLFVDVRGFTALSEAMTPEDLGAFVSELRQRIRRTADASGGIIDKFIGDAAMIVFGLVGEERNPAAAALSCADRMLSEIAQWSGQRRDSGREPVEIGIGVHWGEVFCGAIGDASRLEFTVLGDAVNVAARLQELTKQAGLPLLASRDALEAAGMGSRAAGWQALERTSLRGRRGAIEVFGCGGQL